VVTTPSYFHIIILIAFLVDYFIRNIIIYALLINLNNNKICITLNNINNNYYGILQDPIFLLKIPMRSERISSKSIENLDTRPQKYRCRPSLSLLTRKVALNEERLILLASILLYGDK